MTIMFQYKGKAYSFTSALEQLIDIGPILEGLKDERLRNTQASPLPPEEFYAFLPVSVTSMRLYSKLDDINENKI